MPANKKAKTTKEKVVEPTVTSAKKIVQKFFKLTPQERETVYTQINDNAKGNFPYFFITILSTVIITLGLIIDSGAVIIGGMLIAPLLWPVLSFSIAVTRARVYTVKKSSSVLFVSFVLILAVSIIIGYITPLNLSGNEIIYRTKPTLIELLIGLSSGLVAAYSVSSKKIVSNLAGVAIAVSLVPPLCVSGLSIVNGDYVSMIGSLLLFVSNLLAIILSSVTVFMLEGYFTSATETNEQARRGYLTWGFLLLVVTFIPLMVITKSLVADQSRQNFVVQTTKAIYPQAKIVEAVTDDKDIYVTVDLTIQSETNIDQQVLERLSTIFSTKFEKPVKVSIVEVPVVKSSATNYSIVK